MDRSVILNGDSATEGMQCPVVVSNRTRPYPQSPMGWTRAKELVLSNQAETVTLHGRSKEQSLYYRTRRAELLKEYATLGDAVKIRILKYDFVINADSLKAAVSSEVHGIRKPVFVINDFPYFFEHGVEHHVIWSEEELSNEDIEDVIRVNRDGYETVWFRNSPALQTIPELWHVHVLSCPLSKIQREAF